MQSLISCQWAIQAFRVALNPLISYVNILTPRFIQILDGGFEIIIALHTVEYTGYEVVFTF
jgi:hypothetical protein